MSPVPGPGSRPSQLGEGWLAQHSAVWEQARGQLRALDGTSEELAPWVNGEVYPFEGDVVATEELAQLGGLTLPGLPDEVDEPRGARVGI